MAMTWSTAVLAATNSEPKVHVPMSIVSYIANELGLD